MHEHEHEHEHERERETDLDNLPAPLDDAVVLLREEPPVPANWRAELLAGVDEARLDRMTRTERRWSARPFTAIAAGVLCAVVGGGIAIGLSNAWRRPPRSSAESPVMAMGRLAPGTASSSHVAPTLGVSQVRFALVAPKAAHVSIVGDFNEWNPSALPLRRLADGRTWQIDVPLAPGRYTYAFFVDGRIARDSAAAESANDGFGINNSVVLVKGS
jgi:hypothetical protein